MGSDVRSLFLFIFAGIVFSNGRAISVWEMALSPCKTLSQFGKRHPFENFVNCLNSLGRKLQFPAEETAIP